jgi:hypothetical protein
MWPVAFTFKICPFIIKLNLGMIIGNLAGGRNVEGFVC